MVEQEAIFPGPGGALFRRSAAAAGACGCVMTSPYFGSRLAVPRYKTLLARVVNPVLPWLRVASGLSDTMMTSDAAMRADTEADPLVARAATPRWYLGA